MRTCSVSDCGRKHYGRGYCSPHYLRWKRGQDLTAPIRGPRVRTTCRIDECSRPTNANSLCSTHYQRSRQGAVLDAPIETRLTSNAERLEFYTRRNDAGCKIWLGGTNHGGYGNLGGRGAHRIAYEIATGESLESFEAIHHTCANRLCVEPAHLQKVSPIENNVEMLERKWYRRRIAELEAALAEVSPDHELLTGAADGTRECACA